MPVALASSQHRNLRRTSRPLALKSRSSQLRTAKTRSQAIQVTEMAYLPWTLVSTARSVAWWRGTTLNCCDTPRLAQLSNPYSRSTKVRCARRLTTTCAMRASWKPWSLRCNTCRSASVPCAASVASQGSLAIARTSSASHKSS